MLRAMSGTQLSVGGWCAVLLMACGDDPARFADAAVRIDAAESDASSQGDASEPDAALDAVADATVDALECDLGTATNSAAATEPSLFGQIVPFADGASMPAGRYRIEYVGGCFKYASFQWWAIHADASGSLTWWLVGASSADRKVHLPGTIGFLPGTAGETGPRNGFATFAECVAANRAVAPVEYTHGGGPLAIWLADTNYPDNVGGEGGRNPEWRLIFLDACPPDAGAP
jgi:hypothetical protein